MFKMYSVFNCYTVYHENIQMDDKKKEEQLKQIANKIKKSACEPDVPRKRMCILLSRCGQRSTSEYRGWLLMESIEAVKKLLKVQYVVVS